MKPTGKITIIAEAHGGLTRDPDTFADHRFLAIHDSVFLASAVEMELTTNVADGRLTITVRVTNSGAGHFLPTGTPMRNMLLVVRATDATGSAFEFVQGNRLPGYAGTGTDANAYAGTPGKGFNRLLQDSMTGEAPVPFWSANVFIREDTRIAPLQTDESQYIFSLTRQTNHIQVTATLIFRKSYKKWADAKKWNQKDRVMARIERIVPIHDIALAARD